MWSFRRLFGEDKARETGVLSEDLLLETLYE